MVEACAGLVGLHHHTHDGLHHGQLVRDVQVACALEGRHEQLEALAVGLDHCQPRRAHAQHLERHARCLAGLLGGQGLQQAAEGEAVHGARLVVGEQPLQVGVAVATWREELAVAAAQEAGQGAEHEGLVGVGGGGLDEAVQHLQQEACRAGLVLCGRGIGGRAAQVAVLQVLQHLPRHLLQHQQHHLGHLMTRAGQTAASTTG